MSEDEAQETVATMATDSAQMEMLSRFVDLLVEENERQNVVARATLPLIWERHILDSAQLLHHVPRETSTWLDLGTGAGFPGLIIATLRPNWKVTLVESRTRRVQWLARAVNELQLANVVIEGRRLELVDTSPSDVISARAFAPLTDLLKLSARFSTAATYWVLPKGRSAAQEVHDLHGWQHAFHVEQSMTDPESGIVVGHLYGRKGAAA
ncbi:16S rRNA (guanine(527)-N(7))-methyltransferase RsmG [Novosphingobium sp. 9U]|uniref:16S rRNA (guanine(527)-N(7))-methyltransferase RsmG n=1 Tax=Novosphingobium sp. 9U TaxID=2653158 RepID=UPI0012F15C30|nr:16S rRNA (guanine(527)-N(7))-methyltransferase RsmG [Novosphingobium sp. 9U]VWX53737.1 Ribosomal RNA small subunit methyltransferase G [Novosphingobium sp. 9U]